MRTSLLLLFALSSLPFAVADDSPQLRQELEQVRQERDELRQQVEALQKELAQVRAQLHDAMESIDDKAPPPARPQKGRYYVPIGTRVGVPRRLTQPVSLTVEDEITLGALTKQVSKQLGVDFKFMQGGLEHHYVSGLKLNKLPGDVALDFVLESATRDSKTPLGWRFDRTTRTVEIRRLEGWDVPKRR